VDKIEFLNGEPVIMSQSGADNSLKMWLFDIAAGCTTAPRILKERAGHSDAPTML